MSPSSTPLFSSSYRATKVLQVNNITINENNAGTSVVANQIQQGFNTIERQQILLWEQTRALLAQVTALQGQFDGVEEKVILD